MGCALTTEGATARTAPRRESVPGSGLGRVETPGYSSVVPPSEGGSNRSFGAGSSQGGPTVQPPNTEQPGTGPRMANLPISIADESADTKRYSLTFPPADESWTCERERGTPLNPHLLHSRNAGTPGFGLSGMWLSFGENNNRSAAGLGSIGNESCNELGGEGRSETSYCCSEGPSLSPQYMRGSYYAVYSQQEELILRRRLIGGFTDTDGMEYLSPAERCRRLDSELMQLRLEKSKRQASTPPPAQSSPKHAIGTGDGILWCLPTIQRGLPIRLSAQSFWATDSLPLPTPNRPANPSPSILLPDLPSPSSSVVSSPFTTASWKEALLGIVTITNHAFNEEHLSLAELQIAIGRIEWLFSKHPAADYPPRHDIVLLYTLLVTLHDTVVLLQQPVRFLENFNQVDSTGVAFDGEVLVKENLDDSAFSSPHRIQVKCDTMMSARLDAAIEDAVGLFAARQTKIVSYILALLEEHLQASLPS